MVDREKPCYMVWVVDDGEWRCHNTRCAMCHDSARYKDKGQPPPCPMPNERDDAS